jgi:hypothetical protein
MYVPRVKISRSATSAQQSVSLVSPLSRWWAAFRAHSVVVATPQILLNLLTHGIIKASLLHTDQASRPSPGPSCSPLLQLISLSSVYCAKLAMHPLGRHRRCVRSTFWSLTSATTAPPTTRTTGSCKHSTTHTCAHCPNAH